MQGFRKRTDAFDNPVITYTDELDHGIIAHVDPYGRHLELTTNGTVFIPAEDVAELISQLQIMNGVSANLKAMRVPAEETR